MKDSNTEYILRIGSEKMFEWSIRDWIKSGKRPEKETQMYYLAKIERLATAQFRYKSKSVDNLFLIEKYLFLDGRVMIWKSDIFGWVITRCVETAFDINGLAIRWKPVLMQPKNYTPIPTPDMGIDDDCIVIYDISNRMVRSNFATIWIDEIADIEETIKSQVFLQKTPMIAICDNPKDVNQIKKTIVDIANNVKVLFLGKDLRSEIKSLSMDAPFNITELQALLKTKESEMLEFLGIDSQSTFQKKERLITSEQESNSQILTYLLNDRYESRKNALEKLKLKGCVIEIEKVSVNDPNTPIDEKGSDEIDSEN